MNFFFYNFPNSDLWRHFGPKTTQVWTFSSKWHILTNLTPLLVFCIQIYLNKPVRNNFYKLLVKNSLSTHPQNFDLWRHFGPKITQFWQFSPKMTYFEKIDPINAMFDQFMPINLIEIIFINFYRNFVFNTFPQKFWPMT